MKAFYFFIFTFYFLNCSAVRAQYAPQAGLPSSTAIPATGPFEAWATNCTIQRGYLDIANPSLGLVSSGDSTFALGMADNSTVSLGDSGIAVVTFSSPVFNGPGPDFAVFENGFLNPGNDSQAYLELAFVEVSSDGVNYTRFPATSLTQTNTQLQGASLTESYMYANSLNNLAGKYVANYGTPFDLDELAGTPGLDVNNITHIRIVDVIGSISGHSSYDNSGRIINDPYPTAFPTGGFDLDAVGVLHQVGFTNVTALSNGISVKVYPNPTTDNLIRSINGAIPAGLEASLTTIEGTILRQVQVSGNTTSLSVQQYPAGMYYLQFHDANGNKWVEKVSKR